NIGLSTLYAPTARLVGVEALLHLAFDLLQLSVLLYLTGGLANPFSVLLVAPVTISATLLSARATVALILIAMAILGVLWQWSLPLPWAGPPPVLPPIYVLASLVALGFTVVFLAIYVLRVSLDARRWQQALVITQAVLERETKMSALGALAAASAHELGGPLGTISLVARDLAETLGGDPDFGEDVALLDREARRCREIMTDLARRAEVDAPFPHVPLRVLLHEVVQPFEASGKSVVVEAPATVVARTPELLHGLVNLVDNAVRHAAREVRIVAIADAETVTLQILDDGAGFPPELLPHLGEPYLGPSRSARGGTGLGIFIATTLIERTGGALTFRNAAGGGAVVEINWPIAYIAAGTEGQA
ncbi:ActS/PrrB/RegB family redox-sensitive histidine kinase, partial [Sphingosinicella sp.]|uniref:ActS/PrrB/RegB family redox-sensitive histidine kinase n=1 Tax=Sphingosinicella sp. TaxID=1917971 RepID=UPI002625676C